MNTQGETGAEKLCSKDYEKLRLYIIAVVDILLFFSNRFPIAYSEITGILAKLVSGGLGFHETQIPERILQSEDA